MPGTFSVDDAMCAQILPKIVKFLQDFNGKCEKYY